MDMDSSARRLGLDTAERNKVVSIVLQRRFSKAGSSNSIYTGRAKSSIDLKTAYYGMNIPLRFKLSA
jgi:hypothetical protein